MLFTVSILTIFLCNCIIILNDVELVLNAARERERERNDESRTTTEISIENRLENRTRISTECDIMKENKDVIT